MSVESNTGIKKCLFAVEYPGVVNNVEKALSTLGGIPSISEAMLNETKLELRFRPDNVFTAPAFATKQPVNALVVKIKVKKRSRDIVSYEVLGHINKEFQFKHMCDFQYLPTAGGRMLYDDIVPKNVLDFEYKFRSSVSFLPPPNFAKYSNIQEYYFHTKEIENVQSSLLKKQDKKINKRTTRTWYVSFDVDNIPTEPREACKNKPGKQEYFETLKKMFEERPVWSKIALLKLTKIPSERLKEALPMVAYYFCTGPWRTLWVRFGYDPRTDPEARIYQSLDYRVPLNFRKKIKNLGRRGVTKQLGDGVVEEERKENLNYIFEPGMLPPCKQYFVQMCDIKLPEVQNMLSASPSDTARCAEVHGWIEQAAIVKTRKIMNEYVLEEITRKQGTDSADVSAVDESSSPSSESDDDDDNDEDIDDDDEDDGADNDMQSASNWT